MKNQYVLSCLIILGNTVYCAAQQFSFQLNFVDAVGNKDSIVIGYDTAATDSLDASFGEMNSITTPWDSLLDVRLTNEWLQRTKGQAPSFHTKKQIINESCGNWLKPIEIDIYTPYWPVTATWDSSYFSEVCINNAYIGGIVGGVVFDVSPVSDLFYNFLSDNNSVTFTQNNELQLNPNQYDDFSYGESSGKTVSVFWMGFGIEFLGIDELNVDQRLVINPNPFQDQFTIKLPTWFEEPELIELFSGTGQKIQTVTKVENLVLVSLESGFYILEVENSDGSRLISKIQKQ